ILPRDLTSHRTGARFRWFFHVDAFSVFVSCEFNFALLVVDSRITGCRLAFSGSRGLATPRWGEPASLGKSYRLQLGTTMGLWGSAASKKSSELLSAGRNHVCWQGGS